MKSGLLLCLRGCVISIVCLDGFGNQFGRKNCINSVCASWGVCSLAFSNRNSFNFKLDSGTVSELTHLTSQYDEFIG